MIKLVTANKGDLPRIQALLESARSYHHFVSGKAAKAGDSEKLWEALPQKKEPEDKLVLIAVDGDTDVGLVDLIHGYPNPDTAFLGLLLINESLHHKGLGKAVYQEVEKVVREVELKKIRLAVVMTNPVQGFWEKMGFKETGETKQYRNNKVNSISVLMEKNL